MSFFLSCTQSIFLTLYSFCFIMFCYADTQIHTQNDNFYLFKQIILSGAQINLCLPAKH